jgi:hypothetical protein
LLFPDVDEMELQEGWQPLVDIPKGGGITATDVLDVLAKRHDEGGWNGRPGRWVFLREVPAETGSYGEPQRFDALAIGLVPSNNYARIVYEVKVSRADWLRELKPKTILKYDGRLRVSPDVAREAMRRKDDEALDRLLGAGYTIEERAKWAAAMEIATEFWYAAPVRCILPTELPEGAGLLEVRPWGREGELRARVVASARRMDAPNPGPEFWAATLRCLAGRRVAS